MHTLTHAHAHAHTQRKTHTNTHKGKINAHACRAETFVAQFQDVVELVDIRDEAGQREKCSCKAREALLFGSKKNGEAKGSQAKRKKEAAG